MAHFFKKKIAQDKIDENRFNQFKSISFNEVKHEYTNFSTLEKSSLIICCNCCDLFNQLIRVHYFGVEYLVMGH